MGSQQQGKITFASDVNVLTNQPNQFFDASGNVETQWMWMWLHTLQGMVTISLFNWGGALPNTGWHRTGYKSAHVSRCTLTDWNTFWEVLRKQWQNFKMPPYQVHAIHQLLPLHPAKLWKYEPTDTGVMVPSL
jgi:hypothetical protein